MYWWPIVGIALILLSSCSPKRELDIAYELEIGGSSVYLLGVLHMVPKRLSGISSVSRAKFESCDRFALELDLDQPVSDIARAYRTQGIQHPSVVDKDPATAEKLRHQFAGAMPDDLVTEILLGPMVRLYRALQVTSAGSRDLGEFTVGPDSQLFALAKEKGQKIFALETVEDMVRDELAQDEAMLARKIAVLVRARETPDLTREWADAYQVVLRHYAEGDGEALVQDMDRFYTQQFGSSKALANEMDLRSANMVKRIAQLATEGPCLFVAVGAGHLGGPNGIVEVLQRNHGAKKRPLNS
jgi:uncharacterized protein YbaP (TraB family)